MIRRKEGGRKEGKGGEGSRDKNEFAWICGVEKEQKKEIRTKMTLYPEIFKGFLHILHT